MIYFTRLFLSGKHGPKRGFFFFFYDMFDPDFDYLRRYHRTTKPEEVIRRKQPFFLTIF